MGKPGTKKENDGKGRQDENDNLAVRQTCHGNLPTKEMIEALKAIVKIKPCEGCCPCANEMEKIAREALKNEGPITFTSVPMVIQGEGDWKEYGGKFKDTDFNVT